MASMPAGYEATIPCVATNTVRGIVQSLHVPRNSYSYAYGDLTVPGKIVGLSWGDYKQFLSSLGEKHVRHYYNQGTLEIMSPSKNHDILKKRLGRLIERMSWSLRISIQSVGSMTVASELTERVFEPDESYYIANEPKVRCKRSFESDVDLRRI